MKRMRKIRCCYCKAVIPQSNISDNDINRLQIQICETCRKKFLKIINGVKMKGG